MALLVALCCLSRPCGAQDEGGPQVARDTPVPGVEGAVVKAAGRVGNDIVQAERRISLANAARRTSKISVDGRITEREYGAAHPVSLDRKEQLSTSGKFWKGEESCAAKMRLVWDAETLYAGIEVTDEKIIGVPNKALWDGDSIELYLDTGTDADMFEGIYHPHQGRLNCAPPAKPGGKARVYFKTANSKGAFLYYGTADYKGGFKHIDTKRVRIASQRTAAGYTLELAIPVKNVKLTGGMVWGMNFVLIDNDAGILAPIASAEALNWAGKESWMNPLEFGFIVLAP